MLHSRQTIVTLVVLVLAAALTACGGPGEPVEPPDGGDRSEPASEEATLDDTEWMLTSLNGSSLLEGSNITLNFAEEGAGGFAGCNAYGGEYTAADEGTLTIGEMMITLMACQTPEGILEQERAYIEALRNAAAYWVMDDCLEIANAAGETTLVFRMKEEFPMDPSDLVGTVWQIVSMDNRNPVEGSTITFAFHNENQVSGSAGCRGYVGGYEASGDDIRFPWLTMIGAACLEQEALMRQEGQYTDHLSWVTNYRLSEGQLEILTARGEVLVFELLPKDSNASLERTTWVLTAFIEEKTVEGMDIPLLMPTNLLAETAITATFEDSTVSGSAGCNTYFATYTCDGSFLTCETPAATEMACSGPAGIMEQEQRYLGFLEDVTVYRIYGSHLWLETGAGRALVFTAQE
ncbi:MAG: META domain-containing protein [Chloroflexota bacterium]|nr:META domain-containing protein [Chloroflexota bacterium]